MVRTPITALTLTGIPHSTVFGPVSALDGTPALVYRCTTADGVFWLTDVVGVSRLQLRAPETTVEVLVVGRAGRA
ncbi:hypothetical protein [Novispirillum itersonii]|uniref:hypothetical protein n=1 Tax=Novispirillum itersonii TaxID=189 RepID=UPI000380D14D|nr:hypothetical protein [Novispirillum itersonii]